MRSTACTTSIAYAEFAIAHYENIPEDARTEQVRKALLDKVGAIRFREIHDWIAFQRRLLSEERAQEQQIGGTSHTHPSAADGPTA